MSQEYNEHPVGSTLNHSIRILPRIANCIENYTRDPAAAQSDILAHPWYGYGTDIRMRVWYCVFMAHGYESDSRIMYSVL